MSDKKGLNSVERFAWAFLQSLWVGGIWVTLLIIFPTLNKSILAPLLAYSVIAELEPRIILLALVCIFLQLCLFFKAAGFSAVYKIAIGRTMALVLLLSGAFLIINSAELLDYKIRGLLYLAIALLGLLLMLQMPPWLQKQRETQ